MDMLIDKTPVLHAMKADIKAALLISDRPLSTAELMPHCPLADTSTDISRALYSMKQLGEIEQVESDNGKSARRYQLTVATLSAMTAERLEHVITEPDPLVLPELSRQTEEGVTILPDEPDDDSDQVHVCCGKCHADQQQDAEQQPEPDAVLTAIKAIRKPCRITDPDTKAKRLRALAHRFNDAPEVRDFLRDCARDLKRCAS